MDQMDTDGRWIVSLVEADDGHGEPRQKLGPYGIFEQAKLVALFELTDRSGNEFEIERRETDDATTKFRASGGRWTATVSTE